MRIAVDGLVVLEWRFESWDDVHDAYAEHETAAGREIPDHMLETIVGGIAVWAVQEAGSQLIAWYLDRRNRARAHAEEAERERVARDRHRELMAAIERISGPKADQLTTVALVRELRRRGHTVQVVAETEVDRDLVAVVERTATGDDDCRP
jgi:hypothetical protein